MTQATLQLPALPEERDRHFRTDHLTEDLNRRSIRGGAVTLSAQGVKFILQMGSTAILARLLTPGDFGLVAMVAAFTGFVGLFKDMGLSMATVQRAEITHEQVSVLFWINVAFSILLSCICVILAPVISWFYREPRLVAVTVAISATFICGGVTAQHMALLQRQMRFTALAFVEISSMIAGIGVGVAMAWHGWGYWSLVAITMSTAAMTAATSIVMSGWVPGWLVYGSGVRPLVGFGGRLSASTVLTYVIRNGDNFIVGRIAGAAALGFYSRAYALLLAPWQQMISPIESVVLPALCRVSDSPYRFWRLYQKSLFLVAAVCLPVTTMLVAHATLIIRFLLGPGWDPVLVVFLAFIPAAIISAFRVCTVWLYIPTGRVDRQLRWNLMTAPIYILAYMLGVSYGPVGVAVSFSICQVSMFIPSVLFACADSFILARNVLTVLAVPLAVNLVCCPIIMLSRSAPGFIFVGSIVFVVAYSCLIRIAWRLMNLHEVEMAGGNCARAS